MRRLWVLGAGVLIASFFAVGAGSGVPAGDRVRESRAFEIDAHPNPIALTDSLFYAGQYDSILSITKSLIAAAEAKGDSTLLGRSLGQKGRAQFMTGRTQDGLATLEDAMRVAIAVSDTAGWMTVLGYRGLALAFQGRFDESMEAARTRLALARRTGSRGSEGWARVGMAYLFMGRGELEEARNNYAIAIDMFRSAGERRGTLTATIGLGRVSWMSSDIEAARECFQTVLSEARSLGIRVEEADAVNNLGTIEYEYGDMGLAARYFERAYELNALAGDIQRSIIAASNVALARIYLGEYSRAVGIVSQALDLCETSGQRSLYGSLLNVLADVRLRQGQFRTSANLYRRAVGLGDTLDKNNQAAAFVGLARSLESMDSTGAAVDVMTAALESFPIPQRRSDLELMLARSLRRAGRPAEALRRAEEAAGKMEKTGGIRSREGYALELAACHEALGRREEAFEWFGRAVDAMENVRRSMDALEWREARTGTRLAVDHGSIVLAHPPDRPFSERVAALFNIVQRLKGRTLIERICEPRRRSTSPPILDVPLVELADFQRETLEPGDLFLDFIVGHFRSYLFAVTRDSCRVVTLPGVRSDLPGKIDLYCGLLGRRPASRKQVLSESTGSGSKDGKRTALNRMQRALGAAVLGETADLIAGASRILIATDDFFSLVPFGTLRVPIGGDAERELIDAKEISRVPSAAVLAWLRKQPDGDPDASRRTLLAIAPERPAALEGAAGEIEYLRRRFEPVHVLKGHPRSSSSDALADRHEVIHIAAHVDVNEERPWYSGVLLAELPPSPSPQAVPVRRKKDRKRQEHFSPEAESSSPARRTSAPEPTIDPDPYLRADEISRRSIQSRLVVLSGCRSAMGRVSSGEGVIGLTSAFLTAGVPVVVASLWPVDDKTTTELMKRFYLHLGGGLSVARALRGAQLDLKERPATRHPFFWAGFVVVGDGTVTVDLTERGPHRSSLVYVIVVMGIVILLMGVRRWIRPKKLPRTPAAM